MSFTWKGLPPQQSALLKAHGGERVVAVRPALVRALRGNGNAAILMSQFLYWSAISRDANGWFFNSRERLLAQTGLGRDAQKTARVLLTQLGLIEETRAGLPAKLYTRVNLALTAQIIAEQEVKEALHQEDGYARQQEDDHGRQQVGGHGRQQVGGYARQHSKEEESTEETKEKTTSKEASSPNFNDTIPNRPTIETPLAWAIRTVCKRQLQLSAKDKEKLEHVLAAFERAGITVPLVEEFGRKSVNHWITFDNRTKQPKAPSITQVLEHWQEVLDLPEPDEAETSEDLDALAAQFAKPQE